MRSIFATNLAANHPQMPPLNLKNRNAEQIKFHTWMTEGATTPGFAISSAKSTLDA